MTGRRGRQDGRRWARMKPAANGYDSRRRMKRLKMGRAYARQAASSIGFRRGGPDARDCYQRDNELLKTPFTDRKPPPATNTSLAVVRALLGIGTAMAEPRHTLSRLNLAPRRAAALVELRRRLLHGLDKHPSWAVAEVELANRLRVVFDPRLLELRRIDEHASPAVLASLVKYKAVHPTHDWRELGAACRPIAAASGLPSSLPGRAGDFHRAGVDERSQREGSAAARSRIARDRSAVVRLRDVLFDFELPRRSSRRALRKLSHPAGCRYTRGRAPVAEHLRDSLTRTRVSRVVDGNDTKP